MQLQVFMCPPLFLNGGRKGSGYMRLLNTWTHSVIVVVIVCSMWV